MDWQEALKEKKEMMEEVVRELEPAQQQILGWLLKQEKQNRDKARPRIKGELITRLESHYPEASGKD